MEDKIQELEMKLEELKDKLMLPQTLADHKLTKTVSSDLAKIQGELDHCYERWEILEAKQKELASDG